MKAKLCNVISLVNIAEKILGIEDTLEIVFKDKSYFRNSDISAVFITNGLYIVFNISFIVVATIPEILITCLHEVRHAYQYMQVNYRNNLQFKYKENNDIIKQWMYDFENPKDISEMTRIEYLNRPTEIDAIAFSSYLADKLLNVKQVIPDEIKDKVKSRIVEIKNSIEI
ncbi:MAG TPA: hypothetical protein GX708_05950 [Gallicola sp.]|nr:hypothetical protein [Gallicola sp.]